jgi:hypothetical protein
LASLSSAAMSCCRCVHAYCFVCRPQSSWDTTKLQILSHTHVRVPPSAVDCMLTRCIIRFITRTWPCMCSQVSFHQLQAFALSKPDRPELVELLRAQPVLPTPGHRVVVEPPSSVEPLPSGAPMSAAGAAADGQAGSLGLGGMGYAGFGGSVDAAAAVSEEPVPDDVPLTRAQLQAKVGCQG